LTGPAAEAVPLRAGDSVHVWLVRLDLPAATLSDQERFLSGGERHRADRFRGPHLRRRFVAAHGQLRAVLAGYLGQDPAAIRFEERAQGKPFLPEDAGGVRFNLSHSGELALVAVAWRREVGVDVEQVRLEVDVTGIAGRYFAPPERSALLALPAPERVGAFYRLWACKEAYGKAVGDGVTAALEGLVVELPPEDEAVRPRPVRGRADEGTGRSWTLAELDGLPGYRAAVAVEGSVSAVRCGRFS
jgi:4'-phosphopantetheinyl transferase